MGTWVYSGTTFTEINRSRFGGGIDIRGKWDADAFWSPDYLVPYMQSAITLVTYTGLFCTMFAIMSLRSHTVILGEESKSVIV